jgi:hypothetical protein
MSTLPPLEVPPEVAAFLLNVYSESHWEKLRQQLASPPTTTYFRVTVPLSYKPGLDFTTAARERRAEILPKLQSEIDKVGHASSIKSKSSFWH